MPAYEYECQACGDRFERRQKMSDAAIDTCPHCGGAARRLISGGAGVIAKGASSNTRAACGAGQCMSGEPCAAPRMGCGGGMCGCAH